MICQITFEQILPIWREQLWPNRVSKIETNSAMTLDKTIDMNNMLTISTFFGWKENNLIVGVNSGHACNDGSYRSRGLWVDPNYRKRGIGIALLLACVEQAKKEKFNLIWSYPKKESWGTYKNAGFSLHSNWEPSETGINAYCKLLITN